MANYIHQYVRNKKGQPIGCLLAVCSGPLNDKVVITTSKAAISKGDTFFKDFGLQLCWDRLVAYENERRYPSVPDSMRDDVYKFEERCKRYFKGKKILLPVPLV